MLYYKALDDNFLDYGIQKINFSKLFEIKNQSHMWINYSVENVFTSNGLKFFSDRNIKIRDTTRIFKLLANSLSSIHIDSEYYDSAFNFVVEGNGTMQWFDVYHAVAVQSTYRQSNNDAGSYKKFPSFDKINMLDSWSGKCALVRISIPHRVISSTTDRYCVSVRPKQEHFFDDLITLDSV